MNKTELLPSFIFEEEWEPKFKSRHTDALMEVSEYPIDIYRRRRLIKITTDEQSEACGNTTSTQYQIEMPGGEYVSLHMKWDYQVLTV